MSTEEITAPFLDQTALAAGAKPERDDTTFSSDERGLTEAANTITESREAQPKPNYRHGVDSTYLRFVSFVLAPVRPGAGGFFKPRAPPGSRDETQPSSLPPTSGQHRGKGANRDHLRGFSRWRRPGEIRLGGQP